MKAIVVEDSRLAREGLVRMLSSFPSIKVVGAASDADSARRLIKEHRPDVLFLDIHMPSESGFELLNTVEYPLKVVFTTAYSEYAINSFEYNTVDYLLKPISGDRLAVAVAKLTENRPVIAEEDGPLSLDSQVFVRDGDRCHLIQVRSIDLIESCKNYVRLHFSRESAFVKKPLNQVEKRLPPQHFFRANRQVLVNLNSISSVDLKINESYEIVMRDGTIIEVSRRSASRLKDVMSL